MINRILQYLNILNYSKVDINQILDTNTFNIEETPMSAGWIEALENSNHDHEHEHEHESGEALEYGIQTFVYYRRSPMNRNLFCKWLDEKWDKLKVYLELIKNQG